MTNAINLAALGAGGIDVTNLISGLVSIEQQPMNQVSMQQQNLQAAQATLSSYSTTLSALKSAAVALSDPTGFSSMTATASDPSIVSTVTGAPATGQWSVSVSSIAQAQRTLSNGTASSTTALGLSGTLGISVAGGASQPINIASTDTLSDIAGKIATAGLRVQASLMYDGSNYHLLVAGLDTGKANKITFDESGLTSSGFTLGLSSSSTANQIQAAQNADVTVGGIPISSATNQIQNAIPGVTLAVTAPTTSPAIVTIADDPNAIQQKVQTFVTAYNAVVSAAHGAAGFGTQTASNTLLQGDQGIRMSLNQLSSFIGGNVAGTSGAYTTLASVGLNLNTDGTLSLDSTKLASALAADPTSVSRLFVTDASTGATGVMANIGSTIDSMITGANAPIHAEQDAFASRVHDLSNRLITLQQQSDAYAKQLQQTFAQMNTTLALYKQMAGAINQGNNNNSGTNSVL